MDADERKRKKILGSRAYQEWWAVRQNVDPLPSDPYRAYMIDLSLHARVDDPIVWKKYPNRRDEPDVDLPFEGAPTYAPSRKPSRRRQARKMRSQPVPKKGLPLEAYRVSEAMATERGMNAPNIKFHEDRGPLMGATRVGIARELAWDPKKRTYKEKLVLRGHSGETFLGTKGSRATVIATAAHEEGHVIHAQSTARGQKIKGIPPYVVEQSNFANELAATTLARRHLKKSKALNKKGEMATGNWFLKYALNTYREGWKERGKPVKVNKKGQVVSGGTSRTKPTKRKKAKK